jgi:hypothetical protein
VILQFTNTALISWCLGSAWEGARQAGRDFVKLEIMAAAAVWTSDDLGVLADHRDKHRLMEILDLSVLE